MWVLIDTKVLNVWKLGAAGMFFLVIVVRRGRGRESRREKVESRQVRTTKKGAAMC